MGVLDGMSEGWALLRDSGRVLARRPVLLLPILASWVVFASVVLYARYYIEPPEAFEARVALVYLLIVVITFVVCLANIVMLELVQQMESGDEVSLGRALGEVVGSDLVRVIPLAAAWALVWTLILVARALTSRRRGGGRREPSARDAARALGGADSGPFSWTRLGLSMFEKLVRMSVFLSLPAVAWEERGPLDSFRRAVAVIRAHPTQFVTAYSLTGVAAVLMALPLVPVFVLDDAGVVFSEAFWTGVIVYEAMVWTLGIYLEQMSVGLLYLWHMKWLKAGGTGELSSVPKPDLLDGVYELRPEGPVRD